MFERVARGQIKKMSRYFPVLFLSGPRQSGKTTLVKQIFKSLPYVLLELPDQRRLAHNDPHSFLQKFPKGAVLDEAQNVPELFSYLQGVVDENPKKKFVLTGSQNFLLNEKITQSLAGRAGVSVLLPLTLHELSPSPKATFSELIVKGFYPGLHAKKVPPSLFYPSYLQTYIERDVRSLQNVGNLNQFNLFLRLCAGRVGQILNVSHLASETGISVNTANAWLSVLEASYIVFRLSPFHKNYKKRLVKAPKLYFNDTGLACYLLGIKNARELTTHFAYGALFENFVIIEMLKKRLNTGIRDGLYYWRDNKGVEIDLIIEDGKKIAAYEIKAGQTSNTDYFKNLKYWSQLSKDHWDNTVIYGGDYEQKLPYAKLESWKKLLK
ncbi:MAG: ATP-binding protein [Bacteroidetes bacterium]|nr:ATP-binding protein [Bacteroidota bacterium]